MATDPGPETPQGPGKRGSTRSLASSMQGRTAGPGLYAVFLVGAAASVLGFATGDVFVLVRANPATAEGAETGEAAAWRVFHSVVLQNPWRAVMVMAPFALTFRVTTRALLRLSLVVAAGWGVHYSIVEIPRAGAESGEARALVGVGWTLVGPLLLLPLWLVRGREKRGEATARLPWMRPIFIACAVVGNAFVIGDRWLGGLMVASVALWTIATTVALGLDRPHETVLSGWYLSALAFVAIGMPFATNAVVVVLLDNLDQTDPLEGFATSTALSAFLFIAWVYQYAFARRGLPARHRAVALFPLQVFEDVFSELFFVNARVFSGGFFVLLALQVARTLGRDTGMFDEGRRLLGNVARQWRGDPPLARADGAVLKWTRIWLQNMLSELTAMFVFVGAIAGEELRGDGVGTLTGLGRSDRIALLGGYGVVFLFEAAAHVVCFLVLRRAVRAEHFQFEDVASDGEEDEAWTAVTPLGVSVSIGDEAGKLVQRHGIFLLATLLAVCPMTLGYVRLLRVPYS